MTNEEIDTLWAERDALEATVTALTKRAEAAEAERDAARDKNIELHNRVRTYNNRAKKLGQKQKKNHKLATYAEESNELLRAERDALRKAVDAVRATRTEPQTRTGDNDDWVDGFQYGYAAALETVNDALDAALAVQPTTGDGGGDE